MELLLLTGLILLNGLFAMSEIALVTAKRNRLTRLAEEGDAAAAAALRLGADPTRFLSTIQIGITAISICNGIVGEAALANHFAQWLQSLGVAPQASASGATVLVVVIITYFSIVVGELVPKRIGQSNAEGIARLMAQPIAALAILSRPFVLLLTLSTNTLLRLLGKRSSDNTHLTEEDIHAMLEEGSESGVIEAQEHKMVRNVFRLDDRQIASLMTPRSDIVFLDLTHPLEENLQLLAQSQHSRIPVCRNGLGGEVLGIVTAKRLLRETLQGRTPDLQAHLQPCVYVPESLTGMKLLEQFRESGVQMVFVVDEYGEIQGLITLQDVLEALAGEFKPRDPEDVWAVQRQDGTWLLDGLTPIHEFKDLLHLKAVPEEDKGRYHTISGMFIWLLGRLPRTADVVEWERWRFEVMDMDGNRIDKVLASPLPPAAED